MRGRVWRRVWGCEACCGAARAPAVSWRLRWRAPRWCVVGGVVGDVARGSGWGWDIVVSVARGGARCARPQVGSPVRPARGVGWGVMGGRVCSRVVGAGSYGEFVSAVSVVSGWLRAVCRARRCGAGCVATCFRRCVGGTRLFDRGGSWAPRLRPLGGGPCELVGRCSVEAAGGFYMSGECAARDVGLGGEGVGVAGLRVGFPRGRRGAARKEDFRRF